MVNWLQLFEEVAWEIHQKVKPYFGTEESRKIYGRGAGKDLTRMIDVLAEKIVISFLKDCSIPCVLISEETGVKKIGEGDPNRNYVILDAIDGTTNAIHGLSFVSTSIAFANGPCFSDVKAGLVIDFSKDIIFSAKRGEGAYQNKKRLRPSCITKVQEALISFELGYTNNRKKQIRRLIPILAETKKIRYLGSTALEVCYVASGSLDAFIDIRNIARTTDLAASLLILNEAGGICVTPKGQNFDIDLKTLCGVSFIAAANSILCERIIELLNRS